MPNPNSGQGHGQGQGQGSNDPPPLDIDNVGVISDVNVCRGIIRGLLLLLHRQNISKASIVAALESELTTWRNL